MVLGGGVPVIFSSLTPVSPRFSGTFGMLTLWDTFSPILTWPFCSHLIALNTTLILKLSYTLDFTTPCSLTAPSKLLEVPSNLCIRPLFICLCVCVFNSLIFYFRKFQTYSKVKIEKCKHRHILHLESSIVNALLQLLYTYTHIFFSEPFENKLQTSSCLTQKYFSMCLLKARTFPLHNHMSRVRFPRKSFLGWRSACRRLIKEYSSGCWTCLWSVNTGQENTKRHPTRPLGCHTFLLAAHCVTLAWSPNDRS